MTNKKSAQIEIIIDDNKTKQKQNIIKMDFILKDDDLDDRANSPTISFLT